MTNLFSTPQQFEEVCGDLILSSDLLCKHSKKIVEISWVRSRFVSTYPHEERHIY